MKAPAGFKTFDDMMLYNYIDDRICSTSEFRQHKALLMLLNMKGKVYQVLCAVGSPH
jgi:hypothetical protein